MRLSIITILTAAVTAQDLITYGPGADPDKANAVIEAFRHSWNGYYQNAFPHDEVKPVSKGSADTRNGWGASAYDALTTALVMQQKDVVEQILDQVPKTDFSQGHTEDGVSLFETTIRYIGGMLASYDLLKGSLSHLSDNESNINALLTQASTLADAMSYAFDTPSGIPYNNLRHDFIGHSDGGHTNSIATAGSLVLEWQHLADLTGNQTYSSLVRKAEGFLLNAGPPENVPWPGLLGDDLDVNNGLLDSAHGGFVASSDSYYEYLLKMFVYNSEQFGNYRDAWVIAMDSAHDHLQSRPDTRQDVLYLAQYNKQDIDKSSQHLACFMGGNLILGGLVLKNDKYKQLGLDVTAGCHNTYTSAASHIGPDSWNWSPDGFPADQADSWNAAGFTLNSDGAKVYALRPEVIESYYYAYQATQDQKYRDWTWEAFRAINKTCRTDVGFSTISNVQREDGGDKKDSQESYWFAETLKYSFMIFAGDADWQVFGADGRNGYVFNTEAHPFKVKGTAV